MANVELHLGDCLEVMKSIPDKSVDAVITDPPYGNALYKTDKKVEWNDYLDIINLTERTIVFGYPEKLVELCVNLQIIPTQWMTWYPTNKPNNSSCKFPLIQVQESIALFGGWNEKAIIRRNRSKDCKRIAEKFGKDNVDLETTKEHDVFRDAAPGMMFNSHLRLHPNEKPLSLILKLVELISLPGDTILDPFMGSGTTGVACVQTGRNFIGIEIDETYFKIAEKRIKDAQMQMRLPI